MAQTSVLTTRTIIKRGMRNQGMVADNLRKLTISFGSLFRCSSSTQSVNQLTKSSSSHKIRGLFNSVVHGSGTSLNVSTFKSNLMAHLKRRDSGNLDPGVGDDSSSEYSEYDD